VSLRHGGRREPVERHVEVVGLAYRSHWKASTGADGK
jgi:hypothetical protein